MTPYLILDDKMTTALCVAAKTGVDVRIITPGIPDKWYVHAVTRANYEELTRAGVRIFEYTPGFIHSKVYLPTRSRLLSARSIWTSAACICILKTPCISMTPL